MDRIPAAPAEAATTLRTIPRRALGSPATDHSGPATSAILSPVLSSILGTRSLSSVALPASDGATPTPATPKWETPAVAPADITAVSTATELQDALRDGAQDIEIREHLDLDSVAAMPIPVGRQGMFDNSSDPRLVFAIVQERTRSIRGNCAGAPAATFTGGAAREPLKPRQCVVAARRSAFRVFSEKLWVDNLLTLWTESRDGGVAPEERPGHALWDINTPTDIGKVDGRSVYITNATFEGPSTAQIRPMQVWQASAVMLQDCTFSHVSGNRSPLLLFDRSSALLLRSAFRNCHITRQSLVDVSFASAARWRLVSLANTTVSGAAAAGTAADALAGTPYFDDVTYATDEETGEAVPEAADPDTAVGGFGGAVVSRAPDDAAGAYDYLVEDAVFDDDSPFAGRGADADLEEAEEDLEELDEAAAAAERRGRGWAGFAASAGARRRLEQVEAITAELDAVAFLSPQDPWLVAIREVLPDPGAAAGALTSESNASGAIAGAVVGPHASMHAAPGGADGNPLGIPGTIALVLGFVTVLAAVAAVLAVCGAKKRTASREAPSSRRPKSLHDEIVEGTHSMAGSDREVSVKRSASTASTTSAGNTGKDAFTTALSHPSTSPALSPQPSDYYDILSPHPDPTSGGDSALTAVSPAAGAAVAPEVGAPGAAYAAVEAAGGPATDLSWRTADSVSDVSPVSAPVAAFPAAEECSASLALPDSCNPAPAGGRGAAAAVPQRPADADTALSSQSESTLDVPSLTHTRTLYSRSQAISHSASSGLMGPDTPAITAWPRGPASGGRGAAAGRSEAAAAAAAAASSSEDRLDVVASLGHLVPPDSRHDSSSASASVSINNSRMNDSCTMLRPSSGPDFHIPTVPVLDLGTADQARPGDGSWIPSPLRSPVFSEGASFVTCDTVRGEGHPGDAEATRAGPSAPNHRIPSGRELSPQSSSTGTLALQGSTSELAAAAADQTVSDWSGVVPRGRSRALHEINPAKAAEPVGVAAAAVPGFAPATPRSESSAESLLPEESFQFSPHGSPMQMLEAVQIAAPVATGSPVARAGLAPVAIAYPAPVGGSPLRPGSPYRQPSPGISPATSPVAGQAWPGGAAMHGGAWPAAEEGGDAEDEGGSFVSCESGTGESGLSTESRSLLSSIPGNGSAFGDSAHGSSISVPLATQTVGPTTARTLAHGEGDSGYVAGESALLESPREEPVGSDSGVVDGTPRLTGGAAGARGELAAAAAAAAAQEAEELGLGTHMTPGFPWVTAGLPAILEPALGESERIGSDSGYIAEASGQIGGSALLGTLSQASPKRALPVAGALTASAASSAASSGAIVSTAASSSGLAPATLGAALGALRTSGGQPALRASGAPPLMWPPPRGRNSGAGGKTGPGMKVAGGVITKHRGGMGAASVLADDAGGPREAVSPGVGIDSEPSLATSAYFASEVSSLAHDGESSAGSAFQGGWRHRADGAECMTAATAAGHPAAAAATPGVGEFVSGADIVSPRVGYNVDGVSLRGYERGEDADSGRTDLTGHEGRGDVAMSTIGAGDSFARACVPVSPPRNAVSPEPGTARGSAGGMAAANQSASAFSVPSTPGVTQRLLEADFAAMLGEGSVEMERSAASTHIMRSGGGVVSPSHAAQQTASSAAARTGGAGGPGLPQSPRPRWPPSRTASPAQEPIIHSTSSSTTDAEARAAAPATANGGAGGEQSAAQSSGKGGTVSVPGAEEPSAGPRSDAAVLPIPVQLDMAQQRIVSAVPQPSSLQAWAEETLDTAVDTPAVLAAAAGHAEPDLSPPTSPAAAPAAAAGTAQNSAGKARGRGGVTPRGRSATPASRGRGRLPIAPDSGSGGSHNGRGTSIPRGRSTASSIPRRSKSGSDSLELSPPRALSSMQQQDTSQSTSQSDSSQSTAAAKAHRAGGRSGSPGRAIGEARIGAGIRGGRAGSRRGDASMNAHQSAPLSEQKPSAIPSPRRLMPQPASDVLPRAAPARQSPREGPTVVSGEFSGSVGGAQRDTAQGAAPTPATAALREICQELDKVPSGVLLCGRFQMLGRNERRVGGQAVVQFAQDIDTRQTVAIKFFTRDADFAAEAAMYTRVLQEEDREAQGRFVRFVPRVEALRSSRGSARVEGVPRHALPPCLALERGSSLQDWVARTQLRGPEYVAQCCEILSAVSARLADMHAAGYVHRAVKPSNVMWLPRRGRWMVVDFHASAAAGAAAPPLFKLPCAPPEAARALALGVEETLAAPALDAWALGVLAFDLLSGRSSLAPAGEDVSQMMRQLLGHELLPWEAAEGGTGPAALAGDPLPILHDEVLWLLHRDPQRRMPVAAFASACRRLNKPLHNTPRSLT